MPLRPRPPSFRVAPTSRAASAAGRRLLALGGAALVGGLLLAGATGCGGDGASTDRTAAAVAPPARTVTAPHAASASRRNCIADPAACGYPGPGTVGVPAGVALTPSGSITVTTPHTVVSGKDVRGTIVVQADDVTIRDTRVTGANPSGSAIFIAEKVSGTVIEDSTLRGEDGGAKAIQYGVLNAGYPANATTRAERLEMYHCTTCYAGPGTLKDSYLKVSATVPGAHYEPVYYGGGAGPLVVEHNTLLNPQPQTAIVFGGTDYGPQQGLRITGNLMAGGGWMVYGGGDDAATRDVVVSGNRFARTYFPRGGSFGTSAHMSWPQTKWAGNTWDATLKPAAG